MTGFAQRSRISARHGYFILLAAAALALFRTPATALANLALQDERYTYVGFVPFISAALIYLDRNRIFANSSPSRVLGITLAAIAAGLFLTFRSYSISSPAGLPPFIAALVLAWIGLFILSYGVAASKIAAFPLLFLFLCVPPPAGVMEGVVVALQKGSADVSFFFFKVLGVPVLRQGFVFSLPGLDIEVAEQCSGIRSSVSLSIASILAGHLVLRSTRNKVYLCLLTIPIVIAKNAVRIVVLSLVGAYVDRDILFGSVHKASGILFSPLAFLAFAGLLLMLYRSEKKSSVG